MVEQERKQEVNTGCVGGTCRFCWFRFICSGSLEWEAGHLTSVQSLNGNDLCFHEEIKKKTYHSYFKETSAITSVYCRREFDQTVFPWLYGVVQIVTGSKSFTKVALNQPRCCWLHLRLLAVLLRNGVREMESSFLIEIVKQDCVVTSSKACLFSRWLGEANCLWPQSLFQHQFLFILFSVFCWCFVRVNALS